MASPQKYISEEELKTHNKKDDLWISIHGKIYNVTDWVNHHPGGEVPLLYFAGQDVTDAFLAYHPGSSKKYLDQFFTGYYLKDYRVSEIAQDYRKLMLEFTKLGLFNKKGHGELITILIIAMMFFASIYGVLFINNFWVHLGCAVLMGSSWLQLGWVGHDSAHYQVMINPKMNRFALFIINCVGGVSMAWWKWSHNAHHIACNALEYDPDLQHLPVLAVSSDFFNSLTSYFYGRKMKFDSVSRFLISYQNITFYPIFLFLRIFMYCLSFAVLLSERKVQNRRRELLGILFFWVWYPLLISCLPNWSERFAFVMIALNVTGIQQFQFSLNHLSCDTYVGPPSSNDWFGKQTRGSLDISCSPWMDWFHGGLQFQIEHHLFPRMPRNQLRKIAPFVKELCKKHNLPYKSLSFWEANLVTYKAVCDAALEARKLNNPAPRNLAWEAATTFG